MEKAARTLDVMAALDLVPSVATYASVVAACSRRGDLDAAETWLLKMLADGFEANSACFSILVEAMARAGELARAGKWLQKMQQDRVALTSNGLLSLVEGLCK